MNEPVDISAAHFFDFIGGQDLSVVFVSVHPAHTVNRALARRLGTRDGSALGAISLLDLMLAPGPALNFLHQGLLACGISPSPLAVMPGYYVFQDGRMLTWDAGLPSSDDAVPIMKGSLLGVIAYALSNDIGFLAKALRFAVDEAAAARLERRFLGAASEPRPASREASMDDLSSAYRTLGVPPEATSEEVEAAWRRLRIEFHPDRAAGNRAEFDRRSQFAARINWARDVIRKQRAAHGA